VYPGSGAKFNVSICLPRENPKHAAVDPSECINIYTSPAPTCSFVVIHVLCPWPRLGCLRIVIKNKTSTAASPRRYYTQVHTVANSNIYYLRTVLGRRTAAVFTVVFGSRRGKKKCFYSQPYFFLRYSTGVHTPDVQRGETPKSDR